MNKARLFLLMLLGISSAVGFAKDTRWKCTVYDAGNKTWTAQSNYQKSAMNKAIAVCKKNSVDPLSCNSRKTLCQSASQHSNSNNAWRCTALDWNADVWQSNDSPLRDDAAFGAKAYCRSNSELPETCFVVWVSCTNSSSSF